MNRFVRSAFGVLLVSALGLVVHDARAESRVRARVLWSGACEDAAALERELRERGVALEAPTDTDKEAVSLAISVRLLANSRWDARLLVADASGREHERHIEVKNCLELRAALAWVLLVLAREGVVPTQERVLSSSASFAPASPSSTPEGDSSDQAQPRAASVAPAPPVGSPPKFISVQPAPAERPRRTPGALRLGTYFAGAFGLLPEAALGPAVYAEYQPHARYVPAFSLGAFQLATLSYTTGGVTLDVARVGGRAGVRIDSGWKPLSFALALEGGRLTGAGSGAALQTGRTQSALWLAAELGPTLRAPLIGNVLAGELGVSVAATPFKYSFRFGDGAELSLSENVELRMVAGLSAKL
ncbi:MAG: hypothetical protein QM756_43110 [Polyangiaceae bacterium]